MDPEPDPGATKKLSLPNKCRRLNELFEIPAIFSPRSTWSSCTTTSCLTGWCVIIERSRSGSVTNGSRRPKTSRSTLPWSINVVFIRNCLKFPPFFRPRRSTWSSCTTTSCLTGWCVIIEGSGSGSVPRTNGSGSRRLKNTAFNH